MAENAEPFWPSLYSRLVPEKYFGAGAAGLPTGDVEGDWSPAHFLTDIRTLRRHIETDLLALFNATCLESTLLAEETRSLDVLVDRADYPFEAFPLVRRSVVNYGLPSMIGRRIYNIPIGALEEDLKAAIAAYEPRLDPATLRVQVELDEGEKIDPEQPISFSIEANIRSASEPMKVYIKSIWDLEKIRSDVKVAR